MPPEYGKMIEDKKVEGQEQAEEERAHVATQQNLPDW